MAITAFVARSFDPQDEARIKPIRTFLDTFRKAGFICEEAEAAEVESVSVKVRKMIDAKDAFVAFFTRRYPIFMFDSKFSDAVSLACGRLQARRWSAPPWVLQESGYALCAGKKLILLREDGVDIPGLQGDLEYVPFDPRNPSAIFPKLSEMINDLLAKAAGREIRTEIAERPEQAEAKPEPAALPQEEKLASSENEPHDIIRCYIDMDRAAKDRDLEGVEAAWKDGSTLISDGKADRVDVLSWDCLYYRARCEAGAPDGLESLRRMNTENPERREPAITIARLLTHGNEHDEAATLFLKAADLATGNQRAKDMIDAAQALNELKRYAEGVRTVEDSLTIATGDTKVGAISLLYQLLKNSGETYFAFATAEAALQANPLLRLRFDLGLDYRRHGLKELALYHFKFLHEQNADEAGSLHNFALLCGDLDLSIRSVTHYKQAFVLGETLSAANLGFTYLDAGMADEATDLIQKAMSIEPHDASVERCLAEVSQRAEKEEMKESELLATASAERGFLVDMGTALQRAAMEVDGLWEFPFGKMSLIQEGQKLSGTAEITKGEGLMSMASLLGRVVSAAEPTTTRVERYTLNGTLKGAVCKFVITIREQGKPSFGAILGGADKRSGIIVFAADSKSGIYAEFNDGKLGDREKILKFKSNEPD